MVNPYLTVTEEPKMRPGSSLLTLGAPLLLFSIAAANQLTVDATGPVRERPRVATAGHVGSIGYKLPLQIAIEVQGVADRGGKTEVDFVLTNSGKTDLLIPVSPNFGDLEAKERKQGYAVNHLILYLTFDQKRESILPGVANLYGTRVFSGTLVALASGESIRILTRMVLNSDSAPERATNRVYVAHTVLNVETTKTVAGQTFEDVQEVGSAVSGEYTFRSLSESGNSRKKE